MSLRYPDLAALVLRIGFGLYMLLGHGLSKLMHLVDGGDIKFASILGLPPKVCLTLVVIAEFFACIMIIVGYKSRLASIPLIITMAIAAFLVHGSDPFFMQGAEGGSKEPALIYLIGFLAIFLLGSGRYSLDDKVDCVL